MKNIIEFRNISAQAVEKMPERSAVNERSFDSEEIPDTNIPKSPQTDNKQLNFDVKAVVFQLPDEGRKPVFGKKVRRNTIGISMIGTVIIGVLAYLQQVNVDQFEPQERLEYSQQDLVPTPISEPIPAKEVETLEEIGRSLVLNRDWQVERLDTFLQQWETLDPDMREVLKERQWYQEFLISLEQHISDETPNKLVLDSAVVLAYKMGVLATNSSLTSPQIAVAAPNKLKVSRASSDSKVPKTITASKKEAAPEESPAPEKSSALEEASDAEKISTKQGIPNPFRDSDIPESTVAQFIKAYELGDMRFLQDLLSSDITYNDKTSKTEAKKAFQKHFTDSKSRTIRIRGMKWQYAKDTAKGLGIAEITTTKKSPSYRRRIAGKLRVQTSQQTQVKTHAGTIEIQLEKSQGEVVITKLILPNE